VGAGLEELRLEYGDDAWYGMVWHGMHRGGYKFGFHTRDGCGVKSADGARRGLRIEKLLCA